MISGDWIPIQTLHVKKDESILHLVVMIRVYTDSMRVKEDEWYMSMCLQYCTAMSNERTNIYYEGQADTLLKLSVSQCLKQCICQVTENLELYGE